MEGQISMDKLLQVLSEILTDRHGVKITLTARPKKEAAS